MESLTDLVFGLALSLTAVALIIQTDETVEDVAYNLFWFAFNFLILISVWISYSKLLEHVRFESSQTVWLNAALLLLVSVEPYLLNLMAFGGDQDGRLLEATSMLYALALGGIWLIMGAMHHQAAKDGPASLRQQRDSRLIDAGIFLASAAPVFWELELLGVPARFWIWFLSFPAGMVLDAVRKRIGTKEEGNR